MNYNTALVQLPLVRESNGQRIRTPEDVYNVCRDIADLAQETFHVLTLSAKNGLVNRHLVSLGTADSALVHPREVFRCAIGDGAVVAVVLVHSHPSGDPSPSAEDLRITRQLIEAGKIMDIRVMDHIVIGPRWRNISGAVPVDAGKRAVQLRGWDMKLQEISRETYGHDRLATNKHSERKYRDQDGRLYVLSRCLDGCPPFFEAYGPYAVDHEGVLPRFKVNGQDYWGDGWSWARAVRVFCQALGADGA